MACQEISVPSKCGADTLVSAAPRLVSAPGSICDTGVETSLDSRLRHILYMANCHGYLLTGPYRQECGPPSFGRVRDTEVVGLASPIRSRDRKGAEILVIHASSEWNTAMASPCSATTY